MDENLCSAHYLNEVKSGCNLAMHQSFVTPASQGPGKCRALRGLSTLILFGSCVVLVVSSAVVRGCAGFWFPAK